MIIRKEGGKHVVYDGTGSIKLSEHDSHDGALRAISDGYQTLSGTNMVGKSKQPEGRASEFEGGYDGPDRGGPDDEQEDE